MLVVLRSTPARLAFERLAAFMFISDRSRPVRFMLLRSALLKFAYMPNRKPLRSTQPSGNALGVPVTPRVMSPSKSLSAKFAPSMLAFINPDIARSTSRMSMPEKFARISAVP